jgi:enediyne biosynthesis protein E4
MCFPRSISLLFAVALLCSTSTFLAAQGVPNPTPPGARFNVPDPDFGSDTLLLRKQAQLATESKFKVFHDFHFTNEVKASGITFHHHAVTDQLQSAKASHYDHGSALAVADIDGDGLYDILFINQSGASELWKNVGGGKFKNVTQESGIAIPAGLVSVGAAFGDLENDGLQDLVITTVRGGTFLFKNDGHGHFKDISAGSGITTVAHGSGAFFVDYDNDGMIDLVICNVGRYTTDQQGPDGAYAAVDDAFSGHLYPERFEHPVLYKNLGNGKFRDVTSDVGLDVLFSWTGDASFADLNGDGFPDIYFLNMQGDNHYFENQGGKKFVDKTDQYFPKTPWGAMGIKFFDFDNDGLMDLLVTDMHSDMSAEIGPDREKVKSDMKFPHSYLRGGLPQDASRPGGEKSIFGNAFYHNLGNGKFEEISDRLGLETYWPWGVSVADINADGWDDVFVTGGMGFPFRYGINSMLLNNAGAGFLDSEFILGIEPRLDNESHTFWFSFDCAQAGESMQARRACGEHTEGTMSIMGTRSSRSSAAFDIDNDGDLDIVTNDYNSEPMVLISNLAQVKQIHWVKIVLEGSKSNRNGLGATVRVKAGNRTFTKYNDGKAGYLAQSVLPLYFGLGDASKIDSIEVDWPSGYKQVLTKDLHPNQLMKIAEAAK